jgi:hypothetical protein
MVNKLIAELEELLKNIGYFNCETEVESREALDNISVKLFGKRYTNESYEIYERTGKFTDLVLLEESDHKNRKVLKPDLDLSKYSMEELASLIPIINLKMQLENNIKKSKEYKEYKVISFRDNYGGLLDLNNFESQLNLHGKEGWDIGFIVSNELGNTRYARFSNNNYNNDVTVNPNMQDTIVILERVKYRD